jgi:hypothetical protein
MPPYATQGRASERFSGWETKFPFKETTSNQLKRELSGIGETGIKSGRRLTAGLVYVMSEF